MIKFNITDMHCMSCVRNIEDAIQEKDENAKLSADIKNRTLAIESVLEESVLKEIVIEEGYSVN